jgi:hypothetical protein
LAALGGTRSAAVLAVLLGCWPLLNACAVDGHDTATPFTSKPEAMSETPYEPTAQTDAARQRVIVSLRVDSAGVDREAEIRRVQTVLLDSLPATGFTLVRRFRYVPQIVVDADDVTVRRIAEHPAVSDVRLDVPVPPTGLQP